MHIFSFTNSFLKRLRAGARFDPVRDWLVLLTLSTIVLASIVVWNIWAFDTVSRGGVIGAPTTDAPEAFNRASLEEIKSIFASRAVEEARYETGVYRFADPSQ